MASVLPQLARLGEISLNLLFPQRCVGCGKEGSLLCQSCLRLLPRLMPPICPLCGLPQASGVLCPDCIGGQTAIDGIRSPFRFEGIMSEAVHQLKYQNIRTLAPVLARLLQDYLNTKPVPGEVLVPVPLHSRRLKERGYNQSGLLVKQLGKLTGLPVADNCLIRERHTSPQAKTLTVDERRSNIANAFTCRNDKLKSKQVILIDDVSTSGATLDACASALKAAGAKSVWGLVLAREV
ncbi:MAG: ComF family protein [Chloroflexota bacterium]